MPDPAPPRIIADRYEVGDVIGQGGHGWVYRARDRQTGEHVAVKMLNDVAARDPQLIERLKREQQALAVLAGTAAVKLVDLCLGPGGKLCLVMELLDGVDLESRLEQMESAGQRMTTAELLPLLAPIVDTIDRAHGAGILHRDLKPANVFLMRNGSVRLLDFGLARIRSAQPLTAAGMVMGSPSYIAPEVWKGRSDKLDQRVDVYSFGVLVYRALAGRPPFAGDSLQEKYTAATSAARPSLHALRPDLPADIDGWVRQILAIEPGSRFHTLRAAWNALHSSLHLPEPADGPGVRTPTAPAPPAKKKLSGAVGQRAIASAWRSATDVLKRLVEVIPSPSSPPRLPETAPGPSGQAAPAGGAGAGQQVPPLPPPPAFPVPQAAQQGPLPPPAPPPPPKAAPPQAPGARPLAPPPRAPREPPSATRAAAPRPPRQVTPPPPPRQGAPPPPRAARVAPPSAAKPTPADPSAQTQVALDAPPPSAASLFHASHAPPTKLADQGGISDKRSFVSEFLSQSVLDMDSSPTAAPEDDVVSWLGGTESAPAVAPPDVRHIPPPPAPKPPSPRAAVANSPEAPAAPPEPAARPEASAPPAPQEAPAPPEPQTAEPAPPAAEAALEPAHKSNPRARKPTPPPAAADSTPGKPKQEKKPKGAAKARGKKKSSRGQRKRRR
jgi:serine/threonine-protein kinase